MRFRIVVLTGTITDEALLPALTAARTAGLRVTEVDTDLPPQPPQADRQPAVSLSDTFLGPQPDEEDLTYKANLWRDRASFLNALGCWTSADLQHQELERFVGALLSWRGKYWRPAMELLGLMREHGWVFSDFDPATLTPLKELKVSSGVKGQLGKAGYLWLEMFTYATLGNLEDVRGIGPKHAARVTTALQARGIELGSEFTKSESTK